MKDNTDNRIIGLDIGTSRIVAGRKAGEDYRFDAQLNAFVNLPYSKLTENSLKKERIPYTVSGAEICVFGNESARFADLLSVETRRPMIRGVLNPGEPESIAKISQILANMIGPANGETRRVCFSVPAPAVGAQENVTYHEATVRQVLTDLGYQAQSINEGLAVIYGELEDSNYTGVGVSCGGGLCNVALAYMSVPVLTFSTAKGGDFIDTSAASVTGELANRIRITKEDSFHFNGHYAEKTHQVLSVYYDDMIQSVIQGLKDMFQNTKNIPKIHRPVPLVLSGGSAMPPGFRDRFARLLDEAALPIGFSEVRLASNPLYSTAKGALVAALAD